MKILFSNLPFSGHINPTLGVVEELVKRGHQVGYINSTVFKEKIESTGATFIPYIHKPNAPANIDVFIPKESYLTALSIIDEYDLFVYELLDFLGQTAGEVSKKPTVRLCAQFAYNERIYSDIMWSIKKYIPFRYKKMAALWTKLMASGNVNFRENDQFAEITGHPADLNLVFTLKSFQIDGDSFDERFKFIGPIISGRDNEKFKVDIPFHEMKNPIIYVSAGTIVSSKKIINKCIEAFGNKDLSVIVALGNVTKLKDLYTIPNNFYVYKLVPQLEVLQHASIFITHAGMNSTNEAIYYGVPMIASPITSDEPVVANRIEELNIGLNINVKKISAEILYSSAVNLINNEKVKNNILNLQKESKVAGGAIKAADLIEEYYGRFMTFNSSIEQQVL